MKRINRNYKISDEVMKEEFRPNIEKQKQKKVLRILY